MTYKATLKVQFDSEWTSTNYSSGFDDTVLPEEHYTFQVPAEDLNIYQLFRFFETVAFELTLGEDLKKKFDDMREAEAEWARLKKGPMGTVLTDEKDQCVE